MIMKRMMNGLKKPSPPQAAVPVAAPVESGGKLPPPPLQHPTCPRCDSSNTKFCYYNNYSVSQPRYFCKGCKRYWTYGGTLRNVPHGGRSLGNTKLIPKQLPSSSNFIFPPNPKPQHYQQAQEQRQQQQQQQNSSTNCYQQGAFESSFNHYSPTDSMMMMSSSSSGDFVGSSSSCDQFPVFNQPANMGFSDQFHMFNQPADMGSSSSCDQFHILDQPADTMGSTTNLLNEQQDYWLDYHLSSFNSNSNSSSSSSSSSIITHTNVVEQDYDPSNWNAILGYESPLHSSSSAYFF